jgi:hypothetical protein
MVVNQQQQKRAIGVFTDREKAEQAIKELQNSGFSMDKISLVAKEGEDEGEQVSGVEVSDHVGDTKVANTTDMVGDTFATSSTGFALLGLTSLALPGIGAVLAAGSFGVALAASAASSGVAAIASNNLEKALIDYGIPKAQAAAYSDRLQRGDYLITVEGTDEEIHQTEQVFGQQGIQDWSVY